MDKVFAQMCVKDEADRYLPDVLVWLDKIVDGIHVYDDRSSDDSAVIADRAGARVTIRPPEGTPFTESESKFRAEGWTALQRAFEPDFGDWVLAIDADEFLVSTSGSDERAELLETVAGALPARPGGVDGFDLSIPEVFGVETDGTPLIRTDGYWGLIDGLRLVRWTGDGVFKNRTLAGGSVPRAIARRRPADHLAILHYGYADPSERRARYRRYIATPGHSRSHVESILQPGKLERWVGKTPPVRVG